MITAHQLNIVYQDNDFQITAISVSKSNRLFLNFPRWSDRYRDAVVEIGSDGEPKPFPDEEWNRWNLKPASAGNYFVCVQSVVVDADDVLWIVDAAAPLLAAVVPGGAKLVAVDLATNRVARVIALDPAIALPDTYLNDVRVDTQRKTAYITDSGHGGVIVIDLASGQARRLLDGHPSVFVEDGVRIEVDGKELLQNGKPPQFNADASRSRRAATTSTIRRSPRTRSTGLGPRYCGMRARPQMPLRARSRSRRKPSRATGCGWTRTATFF